MNINKAPKKSDWLYIYPMNFFVVRPIPVGCHSYSILANTKISYNAANFIDT